ncbi:MAG: hypothetical protein IT371_14335 [Deltaproteobacteria bacterium]|nr:hypothetical protein [Deltaproteobacteria bacterium]
MRQLRRELVNALLELDVLRVHPGDLRLLGNRHLHELDAPAYRLRDQRMELDGLRGGLLDRRRELDALRPGRSALALNRLVLPALLLGGRLDVLGARLPPGEERAPVHDILPLVSA